VVACGRVGFAIRVIIRGSAVDHDIVSEPFDDRERAIEDIERIRRGRQLFLLDRINQAEGALPSWLVADPGLILAAWLIELPAALV
jgi:hypothetical protein